MATLQTVCKSVRRTCVQACISVIMAGLQQQWWGSSVEHHAFGLAATTWMVCMLPVSCRFGKLKVTTTHRNFLTSNATNHTWAFSAVAELCDNAMDARAKE